VKAVLCSNGKAVTLTATNSDGGMGNGGGGKAQISLLGQPVSYHALSYHALSYHALSYHALSYHALSYHALSYHALSCHALSYHAANHVCSTLHTVVGTPSLHSYHHYCTVVGTTHMASPTVAPHTWRALTYPLVFFGHFLTPVPSLPSFAFATFACLRYYTDFE
jgi:hypothetical protein